MRNSWPMWLGLGLGLAAVATGFALGTDHIEDWGLAARFTARVGFPLLILAYVARPLNQLVHTNWSRTLLARRKWIGLGFAMSHTVHLGALVTALNVAGETRPIGVFIGGGLGYAMLYVMAFTSNQAAMKALGVWWKRLHRFGIHYLWFIFALSYFGRLFNPELMAQGLAGSTIAFGAAAIRFSAWMKFRSAKRVEA